MSMRNKSATWLVVLALTLAALVITLGVSMNPKEAAAKENPVVVLETTYGDITIELFADKAPVSTKNFLDYVDAKFYDGLIFHRVISNFMIQGGGFTKDMVKKNGNPPIENEASNGVSNARGTIAMARTNVVNSATSQFFINVKDNPALDHRDKSAQGFGYAVFGKVIDGMDVVDEIKEVKVVDRNGYQNVPASPVVINKAYRKDMKKGEEKKSSN